MVIGRGVGLSSSYSQGSFTMLPWNLFHHLASYGVRVKTGFDQMSQTGLAGACLGGVCCLTSDLGGEPTIFLATKFPSFVAGKIIQVIKAMPGSVVHLAMFCLILSICEMNISSFQCLQ